MNNLKRYREQNNLSQEKLAELLLKDDGSSVGRTVISQLETGKRRLNLKTAKKLGAILNVDPYELMGEDNLKRPISRKDVNKALSSVFQNLGASFTASFESLVRSFMFLLKTEEYLNKSDELFFSASLKIAENLDGFTENDFKDFYILVSQFIDGRGVKHRQALADFADDIKKEDR